MVHGHSAYESPADEDPVVHRFLSELARPGPTPGFDRRVLVNVWGPPPAWVRRAQLAYADYVDSGRIWFVVGAFAAGSLIPVTAMVVALAVWGGQLSWATARVTPTIREAVLTGWNALWNWMSTWWISNMPGGGKLIGIGVVAAITTAVCSVGLYRTLYSGGTTNS